MRLRHARPYVLSCFMLLASSLADAQNLQPLSLISYPGGSNWPTWIAQEKGYFAQGGIEVTITPAINSVQQLTGLIDGKFDIATTAFDNVVAYMEGQGEVPIATQPDLVILMSSVPSATVLTLRPEIKTFEDLRGKKVAVDALTTGYAYILFDMLKRNGLKLGDYEVEAVGATPARLKGMIEGKHAAALMTLPFNFLAENAGLRNVQYTLDLYGHYQESAVATRRSWAAANEKKLNAFLKAFVAGIEWLRDPKNKDEAIAIYRKNLSELSPAMADKIYAMVTGPKGIPPKGALDVAGIPKILELRSEYGKPKKILTDPARYYDLKYYEAALQ